MIHSRWNGTTDLQRREDSLFTSRWTGTSMLVCAFCICPQISFLQILTVQITKDLRICCRWRSLQWWMDTGGTGTQQTWVLDNITNFSWSYELIYIWSWSHSAIFKEQNKHTNFTRKQRLQISPGRTNLLDFVGLMVQYSKKGQWEQSRSPVFAPIPPHQVIFMISSLCWCCFRQGCISCGPCSYPELTEDHVLPSA